MMSKLWRVALHEYKRHVLTRGFVVAVLILPMFVALIALPLGLISLLKSDDDRAVGYVDHAGLLDDPLPAAVGDEGAVPLIPFETENAARAALEAGQIQAYYVLPANYGRTRQAELVYDDGIGARAAAQFRDFVRLNALRHQPAQVAGRAMDGSTLLVRSPDGRREFSGTLTLGQLLPTLASLTLVILIFFSSGYLLDAVLEEKTNATVEMLMTTISPGQLMGGKVAGAIAASLTQFVAWAVFAALAIFVGGQYLGLEWLQDLSVDPQSLLTVVVLLVPAYVMFAGLMTALGATLASQHNDQQIMAFLVNAYLMVPVLFAVPVMKDPHSSLALGLSLFPFTAPIMIPFRALFAHVPAWQVVTAVAILVSCALGATWLAGRAFQRGMLRYGQRLRWRELLGRGGAQPSARPVTREAQSSAPPSHGGRSARSRLLANKVFLVMRNEIAMAFHSRAFMFMAFGLPLITVLIFAGALVLRDNSNGASAGATDAPDTREVEVEGYVDPGGLIEFIPPDLPPGRLVAYADEARARQALQAGEILAYYVVPADYVESGELLSIRPQYNPQTLKSQSGWMNWVLLVNLLGGDVELATRVWNPLNLQVTPLAPGPQESSAATASCLSPNRDCRANEFVQLLPLLTTMILYMSIIIASGELLKSVSKEKENRVMEILMASVSPRQLLTGKVIGLGGIGLLQTLVWLGAGYAMLRLGGQTFDLPQDFKFPLAALAWSVVFFLLGYALYACVMAGAGALMSNAKEAPLATLMIIWPLIIPLSVFPQILDDLVFHGAFETGLSLFPLTSPLAMVMRLTESSVPLWQLLLAVVLLVLTIWVVVRVVARMFRAQALLSGQPFSARRFFAALLGK
jgi:ABC-2 type transport system permease protein